MAWHVLYVWPGHEDEIRKKLVAGGIVVVMPTMRVRQRKRGKHPGQWVLVDEELPLFPRYLFVEGEDWATMRAVRGVVMPLKVGGVIAEVSEAVVRAVERIGLSEDRVGTRFAGRVGMLARFGDGSVLAGLIGKIVRLDESRGTAQILFSMLGSERLIPVPLPAIGAVSGDGDRWTTAAGGPGD